MSEVAKYILLGAEIFFAVGIISLGCIFYAESNEIAQKGNDNINEFNTELSESDLVMLNSKDIYGNDVVNYFRKYLGNYSSTETAPMYIHVVTSQSDNTYVNNEYEGEVSNFTSLRYINPEAKFKSVIIKGRNNEIDEIKFTQE